MAEVAAVEDAHLRRAIALAERHAAAGEGGPFGAVIARGDEVIAEGWNQVFKTGDPTAHAEVTAIRRAAEILGRHHLDGCVLYSSCEPCPMCLGAAIWAQVDRVVFAASRTDAEALGFADAWMYEEMAAPLSRRRLPIRQALAPEAAAVMQAWQNTPNHQTY